MRKVRVVAKELRSGYTTGACAAAGVKAALLFAAGESWQEIELTALDGTQLVIPVKAVERTEAGLTAEVVKFSGDDPDITNGVSVFTTVRRLEQEQHQKRDGRKKRCRLDACLALLLGKLRREAGHRLRPA